MNSGTGNLIGSVSYELASDEACRTKAQHEAGPSPSKHARHKPSQGSAQAYRKAGPARAKGHGCVGRAARAAARTHGQPLWLPCVCEFVLMHDS